MGTMTRRRSKMQSKRRLIGWMPTQMRNEKNMKRRRKRLKIFGDQLSLLRTVVHKEEEECQVVCQEWEVCREVEWVECPTWETLEEHHRAEETPRDQRLMKWTKLYFIGCFVSCRDRG